MGSGFFESFNDENMTKWLETVLQPEENAIASIYCIYKNAGTFISSGTFPGYFVITDRDRIVGHLVDITGANDFSVSLMDVIKIKVKRTLVFKMLSVYIEFKGIKKKAKIKFNAPKFLRDVKVQEANVILIENRLQKQKL